MIAEAVHPIESCWTTDHSLRHCEGFQVYDGNAWLGYVDAVLFGADGELHSLLVEAGEIVFVVPPEAVSEIDPAAERIELSGRGAVRARTETGQ